MKISNFSMMIRTLGVLSVTGFTLQPASNPGLCGTGVDSAGALLPAGAVHPHYKMITSGDTNCPGPDAIVVNDDLPAPPWLTNGPISKWIGPQADQRCCGDAAG